MVNQDLWDEYTAKMLLLEPICVGMKPPDVHKLLAAGELVKFEQEDLISFDGHLAPAVYIIIEGSVLVSFNTRWGDHQMFFARRRAGTVVGEVSGGQLGPTQHSSEHPGRTVAETDCVMLQLRHEDFRKFVSDGGIFPWNIMRCLAAKVFDARNRMEVSKHRSALSRLAEELLTLANQQGRLDNLQIPMRMKEYAWWLDLEPPTLSRTLDEMNKEGWIKYVSRRPVKKAEKEADQAPDLLTTVAIEPAKATTEAADSPKDEPGTVTILDERALQSLLNRSEGKYRRRRK